MSKIRFIIDNYVNTAGLSASPSMDTNLPIDNIKDPTRSKITRSVGNANQSIRGFFSNTKIVSGIVIGRHNFVIDMQYKISLYSDSTLDTTYTNKGGLEAANDIFYISGDYTSVFTATTGFDIIGDTAYTNASTGGTNNSPAQDTITVAGDQTTIYIAGLKFNYTGDTDTTSNKEYTVVSSSYLNPTTTITVIEEVGNANFDGTLEPFANYVVNTGGSSSNTSTFSATGGIDNITPTKDIFYIAGDQTLIFNRATKFSYSGDTNSGSNIIYTIDSIVYNGASTRTEITVTDDITGHIFDGILLPIYTSIPVVINTIVTPNFNGEIRPNFLVWDSGILNVTTEAIGSSLWEWGSFLWGVEAWGADKSLEEFTPPANIVEWIEVPQTGIRGFKIDLFKAGSAATYYEIGRLIIGNFIHPTYNIGYGHSLTWEETTKQYRTDAGSLRSDISIPYRKFEFSLGTITETDRVLLQHEFRNVGLRKDLFVSLFPSDTSLDKKTDYSGIVKLTKIPKFTEFAENYYKSKYIMEEV